MSKTVLSILEELKKGEIGWIYDQLDGTSFIKDELKQVEKDIDQAICAIEQIIIEAKIEELKYHSLFYKGRKYSDKVDWKHEVELIELMNDNRILELSNLYKALGKEVK